MKKLLHLILFLVSSLLFSQNYHYTSYSDYFDNIGYDKILNNKISKIELDIDNSQIVIAYFNDKAQIEKIEIKDKDLNLITVEKYFIWNSKFNYTLSSLSDYQSKNFTFMTKSNYVYLRKGDDEMSPTKVTQYWLKGDEFWYAEKYNLHNYSNTITRSLDGALDFKYFDSGFLQSIKNRKVTSEEFSNERSVIYPKHHIQESRYIEFEYDSSNVKNVKKYYLGGLTSLKEFNYVNDLLINTTEKTDYNNSKTDLSYSKNLITKFYLTSDLYPEPFTTEISYYCDDEKLELDYSETFKIEKNKSTIWSVSKKTFYDIINPIIPDDNERKSLIIDCFVEENMSYYLENKNIVINVDSMPNISGRIAEKCMLNNFSDNPIKKVNPNGTTRYNTLTNLNLRVNPNTDSEIVILIPKNSHLLSKNDKISNIINTYKINGNKTTSYWIYVDYSPSETNTYKGWVFRGGLEPKYF